MAEITDEEFLALTTTVKSHEAEIHQLDVDEKLAIYGYGKQGGYGDCTDPEPSSDDAVEHAKWSIWTALKGTDKQAARQKFKEITVKYQ